MRRSPRVDLHPFTKFLIPQLLTNIYQRPRLFETLRDPDRSVIWIDSPPSYGKTTLVADWITTDHPLVGWITLDEGDNDPALFWSALAIGLDSIQSGFAPRDLSLLQAVPTHLENFDIVPSLINALDQWLGDFSPQQAAVLVLDDFHKITNPKIHSSLSAFIAHMPARFRLVCLSRSTCPLPVGTLRLQNHMAEITVKDLALNCAELDEFLQQTVGRKLPGDEVDQLMELTEGWVGAVQLAVPMLQSGQSIQDLFGVLSGHRSKVINSLLGDLLSQQPEPVEQFLLVTSILDRLSPEVCDRLIDGGQRRKEDMLSSLERRQSTSRSRTIIEYLVNHNVFLFPQDEEGEWFRYHPIFAQYLRHRLQTKSKKLKSRLHMLAARWLAEQGLYSEAVYHALSNENDEYAAELIEKGAEIALKQGKYQTVKTWLQLFPAGVVKNNPLLYLLAALINIFYGQLDEAQTNLTNFETELHKGDYQEHLSPDLLTYKDILHAYLHGSRDGQVISAIKLIRHINLRIAANNYPLISAVKMALLDLYKQSDYPLKAEMTALQLVGLNQKTEDIRAYFYAVTEVANSQMVLGKLSWAALTLEQAARQARILNAEAAFDEITCVAAAQLAYEHNDLNKAWEIISLRVAPGWEETGTPVDNGLVLFMLCRLHLAQGNFSQANLALDQVDPLFGRFHHPLSEPLEALRAEIWLRQEQRNDPLDPNQIRAAVWAEGFSGQTQPHEKYLLHETIWPSHLILARVRAAEGKIDEALAMAAGIRTRLESAQARGRLIQVLCFQSILLESLGQHREALNTLLQALTWGEPEGFVRSFIDWDKPIAPLLMDIRQELSLPLRMNRYITKLLGFIQPKDFPRSIYAQSAPAIRLTTTEKKVLHKLSEGYSTADIAKDLTVSENTAKSHISHILRKLNVTSRAQAVHRAYELILLD